MLPEWRGYIMLIYAGYISLLWYIWCARPTRLASGCIFRLQVGIPIADLTLRSHIWNKPQTLSITISNVGANQGQPYVTRCNATLKVLKGSRQQFWSGSIRGPWVADDRCHQVSSDLTCMKAHELNGLFWYYQQIISGFKIWGFHGSDYEECRLLG
jgi:hypothetical protein